MNIPWFGVGVFVVGFSLLIIFIYWLKYYTKDKDWGKKSKK